MDENADPKPDQKPDVKSDSMCLKCAQNQVDMQQLLRDLKGVLQLESGQFAVEAIARIVRRYPVQMSRPKKRRKSG